MRVWDLNPEILCRAHLLGEHREIHAIWSVIANDREGYRNHPETLRWVGKLAALRKRHDIVAKEMLARGYNHNTPLDARSSTGRKTQNEYVHTPEEQIDILRGKKCGCRLPSRKKSG